MRNKYVGSRDTTQDLLVMSHEAYHHHGQFVLVAIEKIDLWIRGQTKPPWAKADTKFRLKEVLRIRLVAVALKNIGLSDKIQLLWLCYWSVQIIIFNPF